MPLSITQMIDLKGQLKSVLDQDIYLMRIYGGKFADASRLWKDLYCLAVTDDLQYLAVYDIVDEVYKIFRLREPYEISHLVKQIKSSMPRRNETCFIDVYPDSHKLLLRVDNSICEYDIDKDELKTLFSVESVDYETPQYYKLDPNYIICVRCGDDKTIKLKDRNGNVVETWTTTEGLFYGSVAVTENEIITTHAEGPAKWTKGNPGDKKAYMYNWWSPTHIHQKGALVSVGNERDYGVVFEACSIVGGVEKSGALTAIMPVRSNIYYLTDKFIYATYHFNLIVMTWKDVLSGRVFFPSSRFKKFTLDAGSEQGLVFNVPPGAMVDITVYATVNVDVKRRWMIPGNEFYGAWMYLYPPGGILYDETLASGVKFYRNTFRTFTHLRVKNVDTVSGDIYIEGRYQKA